ERSGNHLAARERHRHAQEPEQRLLEVLAWRLDRLPQRDVNPGAPRSERVVGESERADGGWTAATDERAHARPDRADLAVGGRAPLGEDDEDLPGAHELHERAEVGGGP